MALETCSAPILVTEGCLDLWTKIGSGGFGQIYKARHKRLCCDVAIKLLHDDDGSGLSLLRELRMMRQGSSPYVIQVLGVFRGLPPSAPPERLGLVMEFMERGCLAMLQEHLRGAPHWPLVFRLAHQVALGINFLHNLSPPMLHLDLKPSNVLLDSDLNAKLADFGLAKLYHSVSRASKKDGSAEAGTLRYMPPEALGDLSYTPSKASDIYSYGVLLWSIITGEQPYPYAKSDLIRLRIPLGDRPSLALIKRRAEGLEPGLQAGLVQLQDLMERCWVTTPSERPTSHHCTLVTEDLFKPHKQRIKHTVLQVLDVLDQTPPDGVTQPLQRFRITENTANSFNFRTGKGPVQEVAAPVSVEQHRSKENSVPFPVRESDAETDPPPVGKMSSSVKPIGPPSSSSAPPPKSTKSTAHSDFLQKKMQQCQRQFSNPGPWPHRQSPVPHVSISCSSVVGLQVGNNNVMQIHNLRQGERRRHPTAPSRVDLSHQRQDSGRDEKARDG